MRKRLTTGGGIVVFGLASVQEALRLYRGEFLEGVRDEWAQGPRTSLAESYLRGLQLQAQCHLALEDPEFPPQRLLQSSWTLLDALWSD